MEPIVGIDLGTTNSEVAFIIDGNANILKYENDNGIVPSCVGVNSSDKIIVGREALNQAIISPDKTVLSIKRSMGTDRKVILNNVSYSPQEISSFILKSLKERAEFALNRPINKAVITVPAYFTDAQRQATRDAGRIAGLEVVRIINEPTAAALAYESGHHENQKILVYDLGGGTFDVSIVTIEDGIVEVLSSTGDNHLGGDDFDDKIIARLTEYIENDLHLSTSDKVLKARLKRIAENAKIALSTEPYVKIEEDHIGKKGGKDMHLSYELSRLEFEEMIDNDITRTMDSVNKALKDAMMLPSAINKIILVGGSTRIPMISAMLEGKFGKLPHSEIDPDLCVALGASIQAGREMGINTSSILIDITPYTFGTAAIGEVDGIPSNHMFVPLIRRNSKLPIAKSEAFYTAFDYQERVEITVYQGENLNALDNICIGRYLFELTKAPANSVLILHYDLDLNGILKIKAVEKDTGREISAVIENAISQFSDNTSLLDAQNKVKNVWQNDTEAKIIPFRREEKSYNELMIPPDIEDIIKRANELMDQASIEDREEMINCMEDIKEAIKKGRLEEANEIKKELEDIIFYIG